MRLSISGEPGTVNDAPVLATPLTVTTTLPVVAPDGTVATMDVSLQLVMEVAGVPLKATVLVPWVAPKFVPEIVTNAPTAPVFVESVLIVGVRRTVNGDPALATPLTVITTLPEPVAPLGTVATICVLLQLVTEAAVVVPGKTMVLDPCDEPKFVPVIVTEEPTAAEVGWSWLIVGCG